MLRVGLFGLGGVGQALLNIISTEKLPVEICFIYDRSYKKKKDIIKNIPCGNSLRDFKNFKEMDVIVELMGGADTSLLVVREALDSKIPVVTANKALLAEHGYALFSKAALNNTRIHFEAAVGGAIPIINALQSVFAYEKINFLKGILNGTSNYILTQMRITQKENEIILRQAQDLGLAEANPTLDINGVDAAQKLALIGFLIRRKWVEYTRIYTKGIESVTGKDIRFAEKKGFRIRLIAGLEFENDSLLAHVEPMLIDASHYLWDIENENNAVFINGKYSDSHLLMGKGAGPFPTAYAVLSDIMRVSDKDRKADFTSELEYAKLSHLEKKKYPMYLRLPVRDEMGVLSKISEILKKHEVSIATVIQDEPLPSSKITDITLITHECRRENVNKTLDLLKEQEYITGSITYLPIERERKST